MKKHLIILFITLLILLIKNITIAKNFDISIKQRTCEVTVNSKSGPWNPIINKSKNYIHKFKVKNNGLAPPTIVKVKPDDNITIEYIFGDVYSDRRGYPERKTNANGYPKTINSYFGRLPSYYINNQVNHMALIGTFANLKGVIVGSPFSIGNGPINVIVPKGAEQLQLGVNDNLFKDNSGLLVVKISIND